jgi:hypothetical protein
MHPHQWPINTRGLIQHYNVGFQQFTVDTRSYVKSKFAELYGTDKLISSFDGISFTKRPKAYKFKNLDDWQTKKWEKDDLHVDQTRKGFRCIQGGVSIVNQIEDGHVFICIPGSHKYHDELVDRIAINDPESLPTDWYKINDSDKIWIKDNDLDIVRVPMKAGSLILWDSRLMHASSSWCRSSIEKPFIPYRLQIFICMKPNCLTETDRLKRIKAYKDGRVSRHIPDKISLMTKTPRKYGCTSDYESLITPKSCKLTYSQELLHGMEYYPDNYQDN